MPLEPPITVLNVKGTREFKEFLNELSLHAHMPASTLFDVAIAAFAAQVGFPGPVPRRTGGRS